MSAAEALGKVTLGIDLMRAIDFLYKGSLVRRFHTYNVLRQETNGHHMQGVAFLVNLLYPDCRKELLQGALTHDSPEGGSPTHGGTGDTPGHIKRLIPGFREALKEMEAVDLREAGLSDPDLTPNERLRLKFCDNAHGVLFCLEECARGNAATMYQPMACYLEWMTAAPGTGSPAEMALLRELKVRASCYRRDHEHGR